MNFAEFIALPDQEKLVIVEARPAREIQGGDWLHIPATPSYLTLFTDGEIVKVTINENDCVEVFTLADLHATANSFLYDPWTYTLCVHTTDGDDPGTQLSGGVWKYTIMAFFWVGICNEQQEAGERVFYERRDNVLDDGGLELWSSAILLKRWTEVTAGGSTINRDGTDTFDADSAYSCRLDIDAGNATAGIRQDFITRPGGKILIRIRYKNSIAGKTTRWRLYDTAANVYFNAATEQWQAAGVNNVLPNSLVWVTYEIELTAHNNYSGYTFFIANSAAASSSIYLDNLEIWRFRLSMYYHPFLSPESIPAIYQGVGDYYIADERTQFGTLTFNNPGWWYVVREIFNFHNKDIGIKVGAIGSDYEDLELVFYGVTRKPRVSDEQAQMETKDPREAEFQVIPRTRFDTTTYPNLDPDFENVVIPILLGEKTNITPPCVNTVTWVYKVTQTVWGGVTYAMQSIDNAYLDDVLLATPADYTVNLNTGEITLVNDPGNALLTCDAHGIQCDFVTPGTFSEIAADILHFLLTVENGIDEQRLHIPSFLDLKAGRTQKLGIYLQTETDTLEVCRGLKKSAVFQSFPLLNGQYVARRYIEGVTDETPRFYNEDYHFFELEQDTEQAIKTIVIRFNQDPTMQEKWEYESTDYDRTEWKHNVKNTLIVDTYLTDAAEAQTLRDFYNLLLREPPDRLLATLPAAVMAMNPTDKGIFTRSVIDDRDQEISVLEDEVYRILEYTKNISEGLVGIVALKDIQSVGYEFHSDIAHVDTHEDAHGDTPHGDGGHDDIPHDDTPHDDDHGDTPHDDEVHVDWHTDVYTDHEDYPPGHVDAHGDNHGDVPHVDTPHTDWHDDTAHGDTPHSDGAHNDIPHVDTHDDSHGDIPHADSYY